MVKHEENSLMKSSPQPENREPILDSEERIIKIGNWYFDLAREGSPPLYRYGWATDVTPKSVSIFYPASDTALQHSLQSARQLKRCTPSDIEKMLKTQEGIIQTIRNEFSRSEFPQPKNQPPR